MMRINITLVSLFLVLFLYLPFTLLAQKEVGRDGVYVAYASGIVKDTKTGLEWKVGPDRNMSWEQARSWVQNLDLDGGGWRMPTTDELKTLYREEAGSRNMTPLLKTTGWHVWLGATHSSGMAGHFNFYDGAIDWYDRSSRNKRAFAVRSRSD